MSGQALFLTYLVGRLRDADIDFMVTGSVASSFHGRPRATNDIDIVIAPTAGRLRQFVSSLGEDYYVSGRAADEAMRLRGTFNVIEMKTSYKADLMVRKERPFSREEFGRRISANVLGLETWVVTAEDALLSKLEWARRSESERQYRDALGIAQVQGPQLDLEYLQRWARELGVEELLERVISETELGS